MSVIVTNTVKAIEDKFYQAAKAAEAAGKWALPQELPAFTAQVPAERTHGDLALNAAMVWAKPLRMAPRQIAQTLLDFVAWGDVPVAHCEIAGPGFINLFFADEYYADILLDIAACGESYGRSSYGAGQKVMVEFVSANPTGPMHIGNARGGALGDCLAAVLDYAGYNVTREFYINDAGNQIEKFAGSLEARYQQIYAPDTEFPEDGYHGADITAAARAFADIHKDTYMQVEPQVRRKALVDYALPKNIQGLKEDLAAYRIHYDVWFHESDLHKSGLISQLIDQMTAKGLTYQKDGAVWYKATEHGGEKDEVLVRANGNPTYFAADIAYHYNKFAERGFDRVINVWGADHHGHVARLKGAMDAIGLDGSKLDIVLMQMVRLMRGGEVVRVSKRTGKSITLKTLLDDVPLDAARFIFNSKETNTHLDFDLDLAVEQSSQNPVYYVQYAHARICSILKALAADGIVPRACTRAELAALNQPEERELIRHLAALTGEIVAAAKAYDSARITRYVYTLATLFHKFYNACRVRTEQEAVMQARIALCKATALVIKNTLNMLKITAPETM